MTSCEKENANASPTLQLFNNAPNVDISKMNVVEKKKKKKKDGASDCT